MPEIVLHYIWQQRLWASMEQFTTDGEPIEILSVGMHNRDAGPDFSHAHVRIGQQEWVGNIEMHVRASDWHRHHHDKDAAYNSVILHIVCENDEQAYNARGEKITQCVLRFPQQRDYLSQLFSHAMQMDSAWATITCHQTLLHNPALLTQGWRDALLQQRMDCRVQSINRLLTITKQNWNEAFYITLAHNFGFHTNSLPFESLALHTPLLYLLKHRDNLFQITAMLLGQSGLLTAQTANTEEELALWNEYCFLQKKFSLQPIDGAMWKRARMRPQNAPQLRIRQFAQLICETDGLISKIFEQDTIDGMRELIAKPRALRTQSLVLPPRLGSKSVDILIINTFLPYRYAYAQYMHNGQKMEESVRLMADIPAEDNRIIRQWRMIGQVVRSAADTQALIHLYQHYCQNEQCLHCEVASQVFTLST